MLVLFSRRTYRNKLSVNVHGSETTICQSTNVIEYLELLGGAQNRKIWDVYNFLITNIGFTPTAGFK